MARNRRKKAAARSRDDLWSVDLTVPREQKLQALELMRTAFMLLLANHGQLSSLQARQAIDAIDMDGGGVNLLPGYDHEFSAQAASRFVEAQLYLRQGLEVLGLSAREQLQKQLHIVGKAEEIFDSLFDLIALKQLTDNVRDNEALAQNVADAFELVRRSDRALLESVNPLPSLDLDTGERGIHKAFDYAGILVGSPRFWSRDRWVLVVALLLLLLVIALAAVFAPATLARIVSAL